MNVRPRMCIWNPSRGMVGKCLGLRLEFSLIKKRSSRSAGALYILSRPSETLFGLLYSWHSLGLLFPFSYVSCKIHSRTCFVCKRAILFATLWTGSHPSLDVVCCSNCPRHVSGCCFGRPRNYAFSLAYEINVFVPTSQYSIELGEFCVTPSDSRRNSAHYLQPRHIS